VNTTDALLEVCRHTLDPFATVIRYHDGHDGTRTLRAATYVGEAIVKIHRGRERHEQELHAYHHWTPLLGDLTARLLGTCDDPPAILVSALPGRPLAELRVATTAERDAHAQAGAILRTFHSAGPPRAEPNTVEWLVARGEAWLTVARDVIDSRRRATVRAHLRALGNLSPIAAVPCHLDFTPRNLLYGGDGTVRLIDFEHARYDLAARDLVRLACRVWPSRPDLAEAFVRSYGPITDLEREVIEHWAHVDELTRHARAHACSYPARSTDR